MRKISCCPVEWKLRNLFVEAQCMAKLPLARGDRDRSSGWEAWCAGSGMLHGCGPVHTTVTLVSIGIESTVKRGVEGQGLCNVLWGGSSRLLRSAAEEQKGSRRAAQVSRQRFHALEAIQIPQPNARITEAAARISPFSTPVPSPRNRNWWFVVRGSWFVVPSSIFLVPCVPCVPWFSLFWANPWHRGRGGAGGPRSAEDSRAAYFREGDLKKSIVFRIPSSSRTLGSHPSRVRARVISGRRCLGSSWGKG